MFHYLDFLHDVAAAAAVGSEPIYLWYCCRRCSSVNTHIESNATHLLRQKIAAAAAPCERALNWLVERCQMRNFMMEHRTERIYITPGTRAC